MNGFVKLWRSAQTQMLMKHPESFMLYALIALRARRSNDAPNPANLKLEEALIGDVEAIATTHRAYRTAKNRLAKLGLATFKTTNKGTVATITSTEIFDINANGTDNQSDRHLSGSALKTDNQSDNPDATKKKQKKPRNEELGAPAPVVFPEALNTPAFQAAWESWMAYRRERHLRAWTLSTITAKTTELAALGEVQAIGAIQHSISNGWQSIHPATNGAARDLNAASQYAGRF